MLLAREQPDVAWRTNGGPRKRAGRRHKAAFILKKMEGERERREAHCNDGPILLFLPDAE